MAQRSLHVITKVYYMSMPCFAKVSPTGPSCIMWAWMNHHAISHSSEQDTQPIVFDGDPWGFNPDLSVETKDNSIGEERRYSRPDYNRPVTLRLSDRYTNSRDRHDLVEHDNLATRAPVLQAIEELARTSRTSTELWDEYEVY
jgi:hypothetical protein